MTIRERVDRVLREQLGPVPQWSGDTVLIDGLGLDNLDVIELTMMLEEEFELRLSDDDVQRDWDARFGVQDLAEWIQARLACQRGIIAG